VRSRRWKYIRWLDTTPVLEELYDLRRDAEERVDLAGVPAFGQRLTKLRRAWHTLREEAGPRP
jgi:hypothetical protein